MSDEPVTWVLCGDSTHVDAPTDALRIRLGGKDACMTVNIGGLIAPIESKLTPEFEDLIRIAAFVLGADGAVVRGREDDITDERWVRRFRFVIDVTNPAFWNQERVTSALEQSLGFASQDTFQFEFQARRTPPDLAPKQLLFTAPDGKSFVPWDHVQDVAMFSGGLDSFAGAVDLVLKQRRGVVLVTHKSATKIRHAQQELVRGLREAAKVVGAPEPLHVALDLERHDSRLRPERTQRTRSFLYSAIAGAVANALGRDRVLMHENGVIAINLPIAGSVVGSRATRTAHPKALAGFAEVLTLVAQREMRVNNPFALKTRTEIIEGLNQSPALALARETLSCAHASMGTTEHSQCGECSQCIDRQFGFLAAGMQQHDALHGYGVKLVTDEWPEESRRLVLDWIEQADRFAACPNARAFIESFGEASRSLPALASMFGIGVDDAAQKVFELHKRHGTAVAKAIEVLNANYASRIRRGELKAHSLLMLLYHQGLERQVALPPPPNTTAPNQFVRRDGAWRIRFRDGEVFDLFEPKSLLWLSYLIASPGRVFTAAELWALGEGRDPRGCAGLDNSGKEEVLAQRRQYDLQRTDAEEFSDADATARWSALIQQMDATLERSVGQPSPDDRQVEAMKKRLREAIAALKRRSAPLGHHLIECLHVGNVFWYGDHVVPWVAEPPMSLPARSSAPAGRTKDQLIGWDEILPAIGRKNERPNRELVRKLNDQLGGPIKDLNERGVIANAGLLATWWQSVDERAAAMAKTVRASEKQAAATDEVLSNPGERKDMGFHAKERANTKRRKRG